jgi:tRNA threonylcarbamoyladenosine biosynthesis protein TsaE
MIAVQDARNMAAHGRIIKRSRPARLQGPGRPRYNIAMPAPTRAPASRVFALADLAASKVLAGRLAGLARTGDIIALSGEVGAGKTTFARFFIRALGAADEDVPSPTFTLAQSYALAHAEVWHFDLYRLKAPEEAYELGIEEAFAHAISLIEWPERLGSLLPPESLQVRLEIGPAEAVRTALVRASGDWSARLAMLDEARS